MSDQRSLQQSKAMFTTLAAAWASRCAASPEHPFLIENNVAMSYTEVDAKCQQFGAFFHQYHLTQSDLVVIQMPTSTVTIQLIITCFKLQIPVMPISMRIAGKELDDLLRKIAPRLVILANLQSQAQVTANTDYTGVTLVNDAVTVPGFLRQTESAPIPTDVAAILLTSGTTGVAKGVMLTAENIIYSETQFAQTFRLDTTDRLLLTLPLNHAIGFHHGIVTTILTGSTCVIQPEYDPAACLALIQQQHCTYLLAVPTIVYDLFNQTEEPRFLKQIICGGSPIANRLLNAAIHHEVPVYNVFGTTECVPFVCTTPAYYQAKNGKTTAGFPVAGVTVRLINTHGVKTMKPYCSGEILVKGPVVFKGYYRNVTATTHVLDADGWFHTGDLGHYNLDGALKVDGRKNDIIMRGGEKISARKIEKEIIGYSKVQQASAIGVKDGRLGERIGICVIVKPHETVSLPELKNYLAVQHVSKRYWPERLFICESFPMTDSGKVKKRVLREQVDVDNGKNNLN